jgi:hypothetical protein
VSWLTDGNSTVSNSIEMDFYGGFKNTVGDFATTWACCGTSTRVPATATTRTPWKATSPALDLLTLKYSHSFSDLFGWVGSKNSGYLDLTAN